MLEIRLYHHEITQRERQFIRAAQAGRTITWLGRKYRPLRINRIAEPGKHGTELCFEPVGVAPSPVGLVLTPESYRTLCKYPFNTEGIAAYQRACRAVWDLHGMKGEGEFVIKYPENHPPVLTIKEVGRV